MKISLLSLLLIAGVSCSKQKNDCSKFKTGTFNYKDSESSEWVVTRNDSIQIEYNKKRKIQITSSVEWISECRYKLTYISISNSPNDKRIGIPVTIDITRTLGNSYKFHAYNNFYETNNWMSKIN